MAQMALDAGGRFQFGRWLAVAEVAFPLNLGPFDNAFFLALALDQFRELKILSVRIVPTIDLAPSPWPTVAPFWWPKRPPCWHPKWDWLPKDKEKFRLFYQFTKGGAR